MAVRKFHGRKLALTKSKATCTSLPKEAATLVCRNLSFNCTDVQVCIMLPIPTLCILKTSQCCICIYIHHHIFNVSSLVLVSFSCTDVQVSVIRVFQCSTQYIYIFVCICSSCLSSSTGTPVGLSVRCVWPKHMTARPEGSPSSCSRYHTNSRVIRVFKPMMVLAFMALTIAFIIREP